MKINSNKRDKKVQPLPNKDKTTLEQAIDKTKVVLKYMLGFSFVVNLLMLVLPIYSLQVLDRVISSSSIDTLMMLSIMVLGAFICLGLLQAMRSWMLIKVGQWLDGQVSEEVLRHAISQSAVAKVPVGSQPLRDFTTVKSFITGQAFQSLLDMPWSIIFIGVLFAIHPVHGTITLFGGAILLAIAFANEYYSKASLKEANQHHIKSMHHVDIATRNAEAVEAMGMASNIVARWKQAYTEALDAQNTASERAAIVSNISRFIRMVIQMLIIGAGGYLVLKQELTVGAIIAGSILVGRALAPFDAVIGAWRQIVDARSAYDRLQTQLMNGHKRPTAMAMPTPTGLVNVDGVSYVVPNTQTPVLRSINLAINPGQVIGVIGPSAAGKSTLAKLMVGVIRPTAGKVRLDHADIFAWDRDDCGNHVGYLPQDVELFEGDIKSNIARMALDYDPKDVVAAAKATGCHDLILHLPKGYETAIGPDGQALSAGQRQRIALARAFFGNPKLVILDEPNANLDQQGDIALNGALDYAKEQGITTIIVSHRPSIMHKVDKVLVLKDGMQAMFDETAKVMAALSQNNVQPISGSDSKNIQDAKG